MPEMTTAQPLRVSAAMRPVPVPVSGARLLILGYLALGSIAMATYLLTDGLVSAAAYLLASLMPVVALVVGPRILRSSSVWPWYLLAGGQASFLVGDLLWFAADLSGDIVAVPSLPDVAHVVAYPLMAAGLALFIRHRHPTRLLAPLVDAFAIGIAGTLVLWVVHVETFIHDAAMPLAERLTLLAYPIGDVLLIGAAAYLLLTGGRVGMAQRLLVLSLGLLLLADVLYSGMLADEGYSAGWVDGLWIGAYLLIGLAALVPSMRSVTEEQPPRAGLHEGRHALVLVTALIAVPLFALMQQLTAGHIDAEIIVVTEVVLVGLLVLRTRDLAASALRQERRYSALLAGASDTFVIVSPDGIIKTRGPSSRELLGMSPEALVGTDVFDLLDPTDPELPAHRQQFEQVAARDGSSATRVVRAVHVDGGPRWLSVTATNRTSDPAVEGVVFNIHDVTQAHLATEQLRFQADVLGSIRESVIVTDLAGRVTYWNTGAETIFGYRREEMLGADLSVVYGTAPELLPDDLTANHLGGLEFMGNFEARRKDGSSVWVQVHTSVMVGAQGQPVGLIGVATDSTQAKAANARLARLGSAIEQSSESVMIANVDAEIEYVNQTFERTSGYTREECIGQNPRFLRSGVQSRAYYEAMWATLTAGRPWIGDFTNKRKDGTLFEEEGVISPIRDVDGRISGYVAVKRDVTGERTLQRRTQELARERALIAETLRAIGGREAPKPTAQAICRQVVAMSGVVVTGLFVFGLDGRATPYGLAVPGQPAPAYRQVPAQLSTYLRERSASGPWIEAWRDSPSHPHDELYATLGVRAVAYAPIRDGSNVIGFMSVGSASDDAEGLLASTMPGLMEFATIAGALLGQKVTDRTEIDKVQRRMQQLISRREFRTVFQPLIDVDAQSTVAYEALTRFDDGVAPDLRFEEAASLELGEKLELATMQVAVEAADSLPPGAWLNLNASPALILESRQLPRLLARTSRKIVLEITEHAEIKDYAKFRMALERLGPGVRIAVDDAGAGFASLRHIVELSPDFVKLDRSLIEGIAVDEARQALVAGIRHFARATGCQLIAEGVETASELAALRRLDIRFAQGYLFGRPAPAETHPNPAAEASHREV
jgi:PAS domain S-box-containing protein